MNQPLIPYYCNSIMILAITKKVSFLNKTKNDYLSLHDIYTEKNDSLNLQ